MEEGSRSLLSALFAAAALVAFAEKMPPLPEGAFTYAVIPDTQSYDGEGRHTKYGRKPGNHDMADNGDTSLFQRYFPASRYDGNAWYAGTFCGFTNSIGLFVSGGNANSICLFGQGDEKFAVVHIECNAPDPVLDWAAKELERYPDRHVIVATLNERIEKYVLSNGFTADDIEKFRSMMLE